MPTFLLVKVIWKSLQIQSERNAFVYLCGHTYIYMYICVCVYVGIMEHYHHSKIKYINFWKSEKPD